MKKNIEKLSMGYALTKSEAAELITSLINNELNEAQISSVLAFYRLRPVQLQELKGIKSALENYSYKIELDKETIDVCGTGGDSKNTFNISTLSAIVLAATGVPVAKHGNFGSTSISGSSDILKYFGYNFTNDRDELNRQLNQFNICFLHAPLFHPSLKGVAQLRKDVGYRTFFNLLGPLLNPVNICAKFVGVFNLETARLYHYYFQEENLRYSIVNSLDGYDEISLTGNFRVYTNNSERVISPTEINFNLLKPFELIAGKSIEESAGIFLNVLQGNSTESQKNVTIANSAAAYCCYHPGSTFEHAVFHCKEALESGKAYNLFKKIMNL